MLNPLRGEALCGRLMGVGVWEQGMLRDISIINKSLAKKGEEIMKFVKRIKEEKANL